MHLGSNSEEEIQSLGGNVYKYYNSNNPIKGDSSVYVKIKKKSQESKINSTWGSILIKFILH